MNHLRLSTQYVGYQQRLVERMEKKPLTWKIVTDPPESAQYLEQNPTLAAALDHGMCGDGFTAKITSEQWAACGVLVRDLEFVHVKGASGASYIPQPLGQGQATKNDFPKYYCHYSDVDALATKKGNKKPNTRFYWVVDASPSLSGAYCGKNSKPPWANPTVTDPALKACGCRRAFVLNESAHSAAPTCCHPGKQVGCTAAAHRLCTVRPSAVHRAPIGCAPCAHRLCTVRPSAVHCAPIGCAPPAHRLHRRRADRLHMHCLSGPFLPSGSVSKVAKLPLRSAGHKRRAPGDSKGSR